MNKKRNITLSVCAIALSICICLGITYALWTQTFTQTNSNKLASGCFEIVFSDGDAINLSNAYPITDTDASNLPSYDVTIKNTCTVGAKYAIRIETLNTTTMNKNFIKASIDNKNIQILTAMDRVNPEISNATDAYVLYMGILNAGSEITHSIREWIDYSATTSDIPNNSRLDSRITIDMNATSEVGPSNLNDAILAQYGGKDAIEALSNPDFSKIAVSQSAYDELPSTASGNNPSKSNALVENGLYAMTDDYGMSYYYRGSRELLNNNLIFAEHQWKIVRINGDGSMRLFYNAPCPNNDCEIKNGQLYTAINSGTRYRYNLQQNDAKYVGYMYGGAAGTASTNREQAIVNETNSNAKVAIDTWYEENIKNTEYEGYLVDTLFCNDRQLGRDYSGAPQSGMGYGTDSGYGYKQTYYAAFYRLRTNKIPTLLCAQQNDRFTVNDVSKGNGALTYPIGLITADEMALAGAVNGVQNNTHYLYDGTFGSWTMTPVKMMDYSGIWIADTALADSNNTTNTIMIRTVINLKNGIMVTGSGSATDPFIVV